MNLQDEDIKQIGQIIARRYFREQGWKFTDLKLSGRKIIDSVAIVSEQYNKYPYMNRDWYVDNSAEKSIHMAATWKQLNNLASLLQTCPDQFDFLLKPDTQKSLCIVKAGRSDIGIQQEKAIDEARKAEYNVYIFKADVPENMNFDLEKVIGGITGINNFKKIVHVDG